MFTVSNQNNVYSILSNWCICINISCGCDAGPGYIIVCSLCELLVCACIISIIVGIIIVIISSSSSSSSSSCCCCCCCCLSAGPVYSICFPVASLARAPPTVHRVVYQSFQQPTFQNLNSNKQITTCVKHTIAVVCVCLKHRLLKV